MCTCACPHDYRMVIRVLTLSTLSSSQPAGRGEPLWVGIEIQARQVSGCPAIIYQRGAQAPYLAFAGMSGVGSQGFFCFVCGVLLEWLLSESFLSCWTVPFLVLWLQTAGFCWSFALFFPPVQIGISELLASSIVSLRYLRLKENQATYHWMSFLGLKFPYPICLFSLHLKSVMFI